MGMKHSGRLRLASILLAAVLLGLPVMGTDAFVPTVQAATKQEQLEAAKKEAQAKLDEIKKKIKQHENNIANAESQKASMETQSKLITEQIDLLVQQIFDTQLHIEEKTVQVEEKQRQIDERWDDFKKRMAAMQEINDRGGIAILSQATNLYELLTFNQTLQDISEKDNEVLDEMQTARQILQEEKAALEEEEVRLQDQQGQLEAKKVELAASIQAANETISAEEAAQEADEAAATSARKELDAAAAALDNYLREANNAYTNVKFNSSLGFRSPLDSYKYMSCAYGKNGHLGVDWAAAGGTPIHAAADGVVSRSEYHYSYGNFVQIYHGADDNGTTYATLYAHMNSFPLVSVGQTVTKGQVIGYVGTTGNSTGNHLHLELRVNGNRTNPESYIPRPG